MISSDSNKTLRGNDYFPFSIEIPIQNYFWAELFNCEPNLNIL